MIVDDVERSRPIESVGQMQAFPDLHVHAWRFFVGRWNHRLEMRRGSGVGGGEERHLRPGGDQAFGQQGDDALPGTVVTGRNAPRDRREHSDAQRPIQRRVPGERAGHSTAAG